eukprot:gene26368-biopygen16129
MNSCHQEGLRDRNRAGIEALGYRMAALLVLSLEGAEAGFLTPSFLRLSLPRATLQEGTNPDKTMRKCPATSRARMRNART